MLTFPPQIQYDGTLSFGMLEELFDRKHLIRDEFERVEFEAMAHRAAHPLLYTRTVARGMMSLYT